MILTVKCLSELYKQEYRKQAHINDWNFMREKTGGHLQYINTRNHILIVCVCVCVCVCH